MYVSSCTAESRQEKSVQLGRETGACAAPQCRLLQLLGQDKGYDDDVIEEKVVEVRKKLMNEELKLKDDGPKKITETHALAEAKTRDAARMASALGIR